MTGNRSFRNLPTDQWRNHGTSETLVYPTGGGGSKGGRTQGEGERDTGAEVSLIRLSRPLGRSLRRVSVSKISHSN